jgi:DNA-binding beta-propeller fold protein YncE
MILQADFSSNLRITGLSALLVGSVLGLIVAASCSSTSGPALKLEGVTTIAGKSREFFEPFDLVIRGSEFFVADGQTGRIFKIDADGSLAEFAVGLDTPSAIDVGSDGQLIVADSGTNTIRQVSQNGEVVTMAGVEGQRGNDDGPAANARFNGPVGIAAAQGGKIFVADTYNDRIRVIENGLVRTVAGSSKGYSDGPGSAAMFDTPTGLAVWHDGRILVADTGNRRIRVVEPDGQVWTLSGAGGDRMADGLPLEAGFVEPTAVAVGAGGTIYVADGNAIRAIGRRALPFVETLTSDRRGLQDGVTAAARFNRPSGLAINAAGELLVADSDNGLIRALTDRKDAALISDEEIGMLRFSASEFRDLGPARWPYDPGDRRREIAGTLGEIRGEIVDETSEAWFHNGLDIPGGYGEAARFIRDEKVLQPMAVANFGTSRELIRMPTIGYVHIRIGRDSKNNPIGDRRFQFFSLDGKLSGVRVPRGARFAAGEAIGTLNAMNHVHLIAGRPGSEMNAIDALVLPGISDGIAPVIEHVGLYDENWAPLETKSASGRIIIDRRTRLVVRAYDRKDGNLERRRLAPYKIGYDIGRDEIEASAPEFWNISFEKMPPHQAVKYVYAVGSRSGPTGVTVFNFIATNFVDGDQYREGFLDPAAVGAGKYTLRVFAADFFGNTASKDIKIEVIK